MPWTPRGLPPTTSPNYWTLSTLSFTRSDEFATTLDWQSVFPNNVQVFDIDNDGNLDVVLLYSHIPPLDDGGIPIRVLLGDGSGGFSDGTTVLFGANAPLSDAQSGVHTNDFNGDGRLDLFISQHGYDAPPYPGLQNRLILSSGESGVVDASATLPQTSDFTHWSASADIDDDGDVDIYVGNLGKDDYHLTSPYFLINDGGGGFTRSDTHLPASIEDGEAQQFLSSRFFDADNDGDPDLLLGAYGHANSPTSLVLFNDGAGQFLRTANSELPVSIYDPLGAEVLGTGAVDLTGDGYLDLLLLASERDSVVSTRYIQVLINQGDGTFVDETAARMNAADTAVGREFFLEDLNGDGFIDLLLQGGGEVRFHLNDGRGHFVALPGNFLWPTPLVDFTPGDFNGDGHLDFFVKVEVESYQDPAPGSAVEWKEWHVVALWTPPTATTQNGDGDANAVLGANVAETLNGLGGNDVIFGSGGGDLLNGGDGNDYLNGGVGPDMLNGSVGQDRLFGFTGADTMNGGGGADSMNGGSGNDTYVVDHAGDVVTETSASGGIDLVRSSLSHTLGANLDNLMLTGSGAINGKGNGLANGITGNAGSNTLIGLGGADTLKGGEGADILAGGAGFDMLTGGAGADSFVFSIAPAAGNIDSITDYDVVADTIYLDDAVFVGLSTTGALAAARFHIGASAADASDRIIYDASTGALYFDADGNGSGVEIQFATLAQNLPLTPADFVII